MRPSKGRCGLIFKGILRSVFDLDPASYGLSRGLKRPSVSRLRPRRSAARFFNDSRCVSLSEPDLTESCFTGGQELSGGNYGVGFRMGRAESIRRVPGANPGKRYENGR